MRNIPLEKRTRCFELKSSAGGRLKKQRMGQVTPEGLLHRHMCGLYTSAGLDKIRKLQVWFITLNYSLKTKVLLQSLRVTQIVSLFQGLEW